MKESKEGSVDLGLVRAASLQTIVDFIYTGEMSLDMDTLVDTLDAACHLQIQTAVDLCSDYITSMLTFANADDLIRIAETYSLDRVAEFYTNKVLAEFEEFVRTPAFLTLPLDRLVAYLKDNRLRTKSECQLIDAVIKWCAHDTKARTESLPTLVHCIRFALMSKSQLQSLINSPLVSQCSAAAAAVAAAIDYHNTVEMGKHPRLADDSTAAHVRASDRSLVLINQGSSLRPFEIVAFDSSASQFYSLISDTDGGRDCRVVTAAGFAYILRVTDSGGGALLNALVRFDPRHFTLTTLTPCRRLRLDPAVACVGRRIFMFGGSIDMPSELAGDTVLDAVDRYDIIDDTWTEVSPLPHPTHSHAAVAVGDTVYIAGGVVAMPARVVSAEVFQYNPAFDSYDRCAPMHCARRLHSLVSMADDTTIYAVGGIGDHHSFHQQTQIPVERYDTTTNQWTLLNSTTLAGRSVGHFAVLTDDLIVSVGREHHQATEDDIWRYDALHDKWTPYLKAPSRTSLASTSCILLHINFYDEKLAKLAKRLIVDRR
jgi:hypothetical protein